jgi:hypothetical protein
LPQIAECTISTFDQPAPDAKLPCDAKASTQSIQQTGEEQMAKKKEQKKKERERRVAKKKHAAAEKRAQESSSSEGQQGIPNINVFTRSTEVPKSNYVATNARKPFNHRRTGG